MRLLAACLASLLLLCAPVWAQEQGQEEGCTWGQANYDEYGWLASVRIFRNGNPVATINHMHGMDFYWIQCNGVSEKETFNTANDAAWAACWRCR